MVRLIAAAVVLLVPGLAFGQSALRINEFMANPAAPNPLPPGGGGDEGFEWIELYNADSVAIDVAGYRIQRKTSATATAWTAAYQFPTGDANTVMDPGEFLVVADDATYVPGAHFYKGQPGARSTLGMGQGTNGDGIRLVTATATTADNTAGIIDIVVYGPNNNDGIEDQLADPAATVAPNPSEGHSLARSPNGADTNASGEDFLLMLVPTMGTANPNAPACDVATAIFINEVLADPPNADDQNEYVELYNGAGRTVKLEGWKLEWGTTTFTNSMVFGDTVELAAGEWLLIGGSGVAGADVPVNIDPNLGNASSSSDAIRLVDCDNHPVDTLIYGSPNNGSPPWVDDEDDVAQSLAPMAASQAIARRLDGVDTNLSADDFHTTSTLTPGAANPTPGVCETNAGRVVINEFMPNPAGADAGNEWIELYNNGSTDVRVDGWTIRAATSSATFSVKATLPANLEIPSHGRILVGEANVTSVQATGTLAMGSGTGGDAVRLVDCAGNVADTVAYGEGGNGDGVVDDSGTPATSLAPEPGDGQALARKRDGVDTDASGEDFATASTPTPGAANPELICVQSTGNVKLNEILPDPDGSDSESGAEFIELYNAGSATVDLDGWQIVTSGAGDDRAVDLVFPPATRVTAESWFVIGNINVAEADLQVEFSMGNGTGGDAVYLLDCTGAMVDAIAYGPDNEDLVTDEQGSLAVVAPNPGSARALAREDDGIDNNTPEDWFVDSTPTPGATNFQEPIDIPDDDEGGCRGQAPGGGSAPDGCATVMPFGGAEVLLLVVAIRRRRR